MDPMTEPEPLPSLPPQSSEGGAEIVAWLLQMDRDLVMGDLNQSIDDFNAALASVFRNELCEVVSTMVRLSNLGVLDDDKRQFAVEVIGQVSREYMETLAQAMGMAFCETADLGDMQEYWPSVSLDDDEGQEDEEEWEYLEEEYD